MSYKPGDSITGLLFTYDPATGGSADADSLPSATFTHNGVDDGTVSVTVAQRDTGRYALTCTIPGGYASGDSCQLWAAVTLAGITAKVPVAGFVLDGKRTSDLQDASVAAIATGIWSALVGGMTTAGSIGKKLAAWVLGTDDKVLVSSDPQTGVTIPTVGQVVDGVTLDSSQDIYPADIEFVPDDETGVDQYTVAWFRNGTPLVTGISSPTIEVIQRSDGSELVPAGTAMTAVGDSGMLKYDEPTSRLAVGATAIVSVAAVIDGATRTWRKLVMRAE